LVAGRSLRASVFRLSSDRGRCDRLTEEPHQSLDVLSYGRQEELLPHDDGAHRIKERPLLGMEDLRNDPVRQEFESHENADKNKDAPTGAYATGIEEDSSHIGAAPAETSWSPF
jgi:hypothetical protein